MKLTGNYQFSIDREGLWDALMDPAVVGGCIPGVRSFSSLGADRYTFDVTFRVGIVSGAYKGTLEVRDADPPNAYRMVVQATGVRTDMSGEGDVTLSNDGGVTTLTFDGDIHVTGVLARVGQRLMSNVAKTQIDRFFRCLSEKAAA